YWFSVLIECRCRVSNSTRVDNRAVKDGIQRVSGEIGVSSKPLVDLAAISSTAILKLKFTGNCSRVDCFRLRVGANSFGGLNPRSTAIYATGRDDNEDETDS